MKRASCRRVQKAGDVLKITDDGALSIDVEETERRRARILEKQKKLMGL